MEYIKLDKDYELDMFIPRITDEFPLKWRCDGVLVDRIWSVRFILADKEKSIDALAVTTQVTIQGLFENRTFPNDQEVWSAVINGTKVLDANENIFKLDYESDANLNFKYKLLINFTLFAPKPISPIRPFAFCENDTANVQILLVGDKQFRVNKKVLADYSPFFTNLFFNQNFEESTKLVIELKDLDPKEFEVLLQVIHPTTSAINLDNVKSLWELADRFDVKLVAEECEAFVCKNVDSNIFSFDLAEELADQWNSDKLKALLLKKKNEAIKSNARAESKYAKLMPWI